MKHDLEDGDIIPLHSCLPCSYYDINSDCCPAFPAGIPEKIANGHIKHDRVFPGQIGDLVFFSSLFPETDNPDYGAPPWFGPDSTSD